MTGAFDAALAGTALLFACRLDAKSAAEVIGALGAELVSGGFVAETFASAATLHEKTSPTGLPFDPVAVAIPRAAPEHVVRPAIAVATLARGVRFREMGSPETAHLVRLVVVPALGSKEQDAGGLARVIEIVQDDTLRRRLAEAQSVEEMRQLFESAIAARAREGGA